MIDIVDRLRFDATRCELQFSKGVAGNIDAGADEIERLRGSLAGTAKALEDLYLVCVGHGDFRPDSRIMRQVAATLADIATSGTNGERS